MVCFENKKIKKAASLACFFESMPRSPTSAVFKRKASSAFKEGRASDPSFYFKEIKKRCSPSDWLPSFQRRQEEESTKKLGELLMGRYFKLVRGMQNRCHRLAVGLLSKKACQAAKSKAYINLNGASFQIVSNLVSIPFLSINLTKNYILCSNNSYNISQHMILCHKIEALQMSKAGCADFTAIGVASTRAYKIDSKFSLRCFYGCVCIAHWYHNPPLCRV